VDALQRQPEVRHVPGRGGLLLRGRLRLDLH
jgi:hypothetical protein